MEQFETTTEAAPGPADRPDDPLVNPVTAPASVPVDKALPTPPDSATTPTSPTPDQEGCYYLG